MIIEKKEILDFFMKYFFFFLFGCCKLSIYIWGGNVKFEKGDKLVNFFKDVIVVDDLSLFKVKIELYF